ncbi:MAG: outer membrane beta-barrel protein [Calothrix sp. C42_A2020_038]|nr:outer membrane beta-barrel protein [Calothrix sp. C42_A2020_038]
MRLVASALSVAFVTLTVVSAGIASAETGMPGSYIGVGAAAGLTNGGRGNDDAKFGGTVQGRFAIPQAPVSVRGAVLFGGDATVIAPTLTYDLAIAENTNIYVGAGYSFVTTEGKATQLGNRNAALLTLGAESAISKNFVLFGDLKWAIDAYRRSSNDALSLQAGVGYRF